MLSFLLRNRAARASLSLVTAAVLAISAAPLVSSPVQAAEEEEARNIAYMRAAYHSSAYDYNQTAHLVTDGLFSQQDIWTPLFSDQNADSPANEQPAQLFDGDAATKWLTRQQQGWVQLAFPAGEAYAAVEYQMVSGNDAPERDPQAWTVQGSNDGTTFVDLDRQTEQDFTERGQTKTYTLNAPAAYRYYRLVVEQNSGDTNTQLAEWDLLDENGKTLLRHEQTQTSDFISMWRSETDGEQWVYIDLGGESELNSVTLYWNMMGYATKYAIQLSDDAREWTTVYTEENGQGGEETCSFSPSTASYVRLLCQESDTDTYALTEMQVWGSNDVSYQPDEQPVPEADGTQYLTGGNWTLRRASQVEQTGEELSTASFDDEQWLPAVVPGTVLTSYTRAGAVPDANVSDNQLQISDSYFTADFWYRNHFIVPASQQGQRVRLNFDAINWKADIYLNGTYIGKIEGAFIRGQFDVTDYIRFGEENYLAVFIHCNDTPGDVTEQTYDNVGPNGGALGADAPTIHASVGWDWVPTIRGRNIGIYEDVYLTYSQNVVVQDPWVITDLDLESGDFSTAELTVKTNLINPTDQPVTVTVEGEISPSGLTFTSEPVPLQAGETLSNIEIARLTMSDPRLWWPNTYGEQFLYTCDIRVRDGDTVSDEESFSFGVREYSYDTNNNMKLFCNGVHIICRGGNWGMDDSNLAATPEDYEIKIRFHHDLNFTMIRNWVGMTNHRAFYEACDKYGIMVWDDFWLANPGDGPNPNDEEMFIRNARDKVSRNRSHPSVVMYCGRNEGYPPETLDEAFAEMTEELDGTRVYISHSAADSVGGGGPYGVQSPKWYFTHTYERLQSERGLPNIPTYESMLRMLTEEHAWPIDDVWGLHDYCRYGAQGVEFYNQYMETSYGTPDSLEEFVRYAQMINYEAHKAMFEAVYACESDGVLMWMSQSAWPSMVWQTYDYYYDTNAGYFAIKKANQPVNAIYNADTNYIVLSNATGQDLTGLTTTLEIYDFNGEKLTTQRSTNDIGADSIVQLMHVPVYAGTTAIQFIKTSVTDRDGNLLADNFYWSNRLDSMNYKQLDELKEVSLSPKVQSASCVEGVCNYTVEVTNDSDTPALMIRLKAQNSEGEQVLPVFWEDNYFSLMPGESKTVSLEFAAKNLNGGIPALSVEGFNIIPQDIDTPSPTQSPGDVNQDGDVTAQDALMALQAATGKIQLTGAALDAANVDRKDAVTSSDALLILQVATKKISAFSF